MFATGQWLRWRCLRNTVPSVIEPLLQLIIVAFRFVSIVCNVRYCRNKTKVRWQVMYATRLISKALIRILHAKFHCNRLTTVQDIQDYASLIFGTQCSVSDWLDVWMSSIFFQLATPPAVLVRFSRNVAHTIYVPIRKKNLEQIFEILLLKSLEKFWNFTFGQAAAKAAAELSIYTVFQKKVHPSAFRNN